MTAGTAAGPSVERLIDALRARGETLAVAESLTGGAVAAVVVGVPGASAVFRGGLVLYAVDLKTTLGGVPAALLAERGPVDPQVATAMAEGVRTQCAATWGLATTGVAGPEPHGGRPPGTVCLGLVSPTGPRTRTVTVEGDRAAVREGAVTAALAMLADALGVT